MKRSVSSLGVALLCALSPAAASAQLPIISCGGALITTQAFQPGGGRDRPMAVELIVRTSRSAVSCPVEVQAEGWVQSTNSGATVARSVYNAEVRKTVPVQGPGVYTGRGKHWWIWNGGLAWDYLGTTAENATVEPSGCYPPVPEWQCSDGGGHVSADGCTCEYDTPVVVDVAGNGYNLTSVADGVSFDLDADGVEERIAWTAKDSDDGFLALDRNGNGKIDNGSELFGNYTPAYADVAEPTASNGFMALRFAEGPSYGASRVDGKIDERDAAFARLLLWQDVNHNGLSEPEELTKVTATDLAAIGTGYRETKRRDLNGNLFRLRAKSWWKSRRGVSERPVYDVSLMR